jgi:predicted N-acetyltransferase YhbS
MLVYVYRIKNSFSYKINADGKTVGNIRVTPNNGENAYYIGCVCVIPELENKGIGKSTLMLLRMSFLIL